LRESDRRKRPENWRDGDWILQHDNAPAQNSHFVQQFLAKIGHRSIAAAAKLTRSLTV